MSEIPKHVMNQAIKLYDTLIDYCYQCVEGRIIICNKHRWAVERFLKDLEDPNYIFDEIELLKFYTWAKQFKHRAGVLAGKPIELHPFQLFIVGNLLCLKRKDNGRRKFRKAYIQLARKNSKTQLLALISSHIAYNSNEQQECYVAG